ncbi:RNA polymerase sigma-70 factor [Pedobacter sp. HMWF019]|uniref:RNA polymerase sigma-70 factor n=1 Tax=Pedobacter sp. HMWF019 TaxID=2056856 RepID=UPI0021042A2C|nr:RNA polymerase sigma-70 factor [Pedobacter sp. HMWF019]
MLKQLHADNIKAFETVYGMFYVQLCRVAYKKLGDEALVEELVQDVFLNLWVKRKSLDTEGNLQAYLYATLRNKALSELRNRLLRSQHYIKVREEGGMFSVNIEDEYVARETELKIKKIIDSLPPQCREAFILSREEQLSYKAIAERMNISVNTVEKHVGKALKKLRTEFKDYNTPIIILLGLLALYRL